MRLGRDVHAFNGNDFTLGGIGASDEVGYGNMSVCIVRDRTVSSRDEFLLLSRLGSGG